MKRPIYQVSRFFLAAGALLAGSAAAAPAPAQPVPQGAEVVGDGIVYQVAAVRGHGFQAVRWEAIPRGLLSAPWSDGTVGAAVSRGRRVTLRAGSPFVRVGTSVEVLANTPYAEGGSLWVPLQLLSRLGAGQGAVSAQPVSFPSAAEPAPVSDARRAGPWRVVIDPGHGGKDPGTRNRQTGAREKDVALAVALQLQAALSESDEFDASLTRTRDRFVELEERPRIADRRDADLFVSIHVNAEVGGRTRARGFETYYLGMRKSEESRQVAIRENSVLALEGKRTDDLDEIEFILAGLDRDDNLNGSRRLAGYIQNGFRSVGHSRDRGVKTDVFRVLVNATGRMPAVLVELGFITNRDEERLLTSRDGQRRMARAMAKSITEYFGTIERQRAAMEGTG
ncbi:MAG: N-acetylmuramoyl-L-alanine amidase [Gemmatimonadota bacterium]